MIFKNKVYALDLGTTKFCFATVVEKDHDQVPNIHFITVPANGMRRGMLENFEQVQLLKMFEIWSVSMERVDSLPNAPTKQRKRT